jgi:Mrp family chromosome partitioning ATPase
VIGERETRGADAGPASDDSAAGDAPAEGSRARAGEGFPTTALVPAAHGASGLLSASGERGSMVPVPRPDRRTADGYLALAARVLLEAQKMRFRTIGMVSPTEADGRSAAAVNLAVCLGKARGREGRVLLVDGDPRRRALTRLFCGAGSAGEEAAGDDVPRVVGTSLECVDFLTAPASKGGLSVSSPEIWQRLFEDLGGAYPHVVVDCPGILENPEGIVLRECVDQLVLVLRAGRAKRDVERTLGALQHRVLGVVLNAPGGGDVSGRDASS